ncbi:MAG: gamma-glutamyl-gamma-aminobutyrate hydrolase family protein [Fimbriimonadaceae bacterium]
MKPIIGITASAMTSPRNNREFGRFYLERDYVDRVVAAGGAPILIPPGTDSASIGPLLDGLVIPGGGDFDASLWGEETHPEANPEYQDRTNTEIELFKSLRAETPILGICYGCQFVNIMQGGTLEQHMPDRLGNDSHRGDPIQDYKVDPGTRLAAIVGESARGKSWHHQAVDRLGEGLQVSARHEDGTIEAIESTSGRWFLGLQWHPERTDVEESVKLFDAFMVAVLSAQAARI